MCVVLLVPSGLFCKGYNKERKRGETSGCLVAHTMHHIPGQPPCSYLKHFHRPLLLSGAQNLGRIIRTQGQTRPIRFLLFFKGRTRRAQTHQELLGRRIVHGRRRNGGTGGASRMTKDRGSRSPGRAFRRSRLGGRPRRRRRLRLGQMNRRGTAQNDTGSAA